MWNSRRIEDVGCGATELQLLFLSFLVQQLQACGVRTALEMQAYIG